MKTLLHLGAGGHGKSQTPAHFQTDEWEHVTVDINPDSQPTIVDDARTLTKVNGTFDAIFTSHMLEHISLLDVVPTLRRWRELLAPEGLLFCAVPNLIPALFHALQHGLTDVPLYTAESGEVIYPIDVIFGHIGMTHDNPYMAHRCGFTQPLLDRLLREAGYSNVHVDVRGNNLLATAYGGAQTVFTRPVQFK